MNSGSGNDRKRTLSMASAWQGLPLKTGLMTLTLGIPFLYLAKKALMV